MPEIDVDPDIKVTKPEDIEPALEQVRKRLLNVSNGRIATDEKAERAAADIQKCIAQLEDVKKDAQRALDMAKLSARTVPGAKLEDMNLRAFPRNERHLPDIEFRGSKDADSRKGYYDFLMAPMEDVRAVLPADACSALEKARRMHDAIEIVDVGMHAVGGRALTTYLANGGHKSQRLWPAYEELMTPFQRALTTGGAGTGAEWVPTGYTSSIIEDIRQELAIGNLLTTIDMPQNPYLYPVQGLAVKGYKIAEGIAISQRDIATLNLTFNAVKQAMLVLTSTELDEDSIVGILAMIRSEIAWGLAAGMEDAFINGQLTAAIDSASAPAATDCRSLWDGFRYMANVLAAYTRVNFAGTPTAEALTVLKGLMQNYGIRPSDGAWMTGFLLYAKLLTLKDQNGFAVVLTADKIAQATFSNGVLGSMFGSPLVVAADYPQNMDSDGLITDVSGSLTGLHYFNRRGFRLGWRRGVQIEGSRERYFDTDQIAFRGTMRAAFKSIQPVSSTYRFIASGVNVPTT